MKFEDLKDKFLKYSLLLRKRKMFYLDDDFRVIEPNEYYKNSTHREWFKNINYKNINLKNTLRGYYNDNTILIYTGLKHDIVIIPSFKQVYSIYNYFNKKGYKIDKVGIGSFPSKMKTFLGKTWREDYIVDMYRLKRKRGLGLTKNSKI